MSKHVIVDCIDVFINQLNLTNNSCKYSFMIIFFRFLFSILCYNIGQLIMNNIV